MKLKDSKLWSITLKIFSKSDLNKLIVLSITNAILGILDLIGVGLIGILSLMTVSGLTAAKYPDGLTFFLQLSNLDKLGFQSQVAVIGILAALSLMSRTIFSFYFTKRMLYFLSFRSAQITSQLVQRFFNQPIEKIYHKSLPDLTWQLSDGVRALTMGIVGTLIFMLGDISLLFLMLVALFYVDPVTALLLMVSFGGLGFSIYFKYHHKALELSYVNSDLMVESNQLLANVFQNIKEIKVKNQESYMTESIGNIRYAAAPSYAELAFMPNISKYAIEIFLVVSSIIISGVQFWLYDARTAISSLTVFLAAGSRVAPALLRIQQNAMLMRGSLGYSKSIIEMFSYLDITQNSEHIAALHERKDFESVVEFDNVSYSYPNSEEKAIKDVSFKIGAGEFFGIVGKSGSGKSTLLDLMLGLIQPGSGSISISKIKPDFAIKEFGGKIAYVPQKLSIIPGTIRDNITFGEPSSRYSDSHIKRILEEVELESLLMRIEGGLEGDLGKNANQLSGGEAQRIVLARALVSNPDLLVLDESTSSLDNETEFKIMELLAKIKRHTTIVLITHKQENIFHFDRLIVLSKGSIIASGNANEFESRGFYPQEDSGPDLNE
jgi:ABC-type multidrug transport system fused ATPase/permease subunit